MSSSLQRLFLLSQTVFGVDLSTVFLAFLLNRSRCGITRSRSKLLLCLKVIVIHSYKYVLSFELSLAVPTNNPFGSSLPILEVIVEAQSPSRFIYILPLAINIIHEVLPLSIGPTTR